MKLDPNWRTLDCGCGGGPKRPAPGFSAYCDILDPKVVTARPYYQCPMEDMSCFKDKEFDYVRSWHVVEHTNDPARACRELIRIGRAGVIAFPTPQAEVQFGRRDHNFFVFIDRGRLLFVRKRNPSYGVPRAVTGCELGQVFEWQDHFDFQVVE